MLTITILLVLIFIIITLLLGILNKAEGYEEEKYIEVCIESGDTVWDIAQKYTPNNKDMRLTVFKISKINNLEDYHIYPGQIIKVPRE